MFYVMFYVLYMSYVELVSSNKKAQLKDSNYHTVSRLHAHLQHSTLKSAWKVFTHSFYFNSVGRNTILPSKGKKSACCHANHLDHSVACGASIETVTRNHLS